MKEHLPPSRRNAAWAVGLVAAGAVAGGILTTTLGASAAGNHTGSAAAPPMAAYGRGDGRMPMGPAPARGDESSTSSEVASTLKAKALEAVPGGTVYRIETDAGDGAYEAHITTSDGTPVTVKFDKNLAVVRVEDGMGHGDPAPSGRGHGPGAVDRSGTQPGSMTG
jgi:hypothetical protein